MDAITLQSVCKSYKTVNALDGVSLGIAEGEFFGLLGPNGAGKTTLIKVIVGLARTDSGEAFVFGKNVREDPMAAKAAIGLSPQEPNIDRYFTVRRTLEFQGGYFGLTRMDRRRRARELLEQFGLGDKTEVEYWKLSGGMQRRVLIARSLMTSPRILILDEPTAGVDVEQRHELWEYLRGLSRSRTTIILTTHYIDEAEALCDRVGVIEGGRIVEIGAPKELIARHCERYFDVHGEKKERLEGFGVDDVDVHRGSLEEVFLKLTGKSIHIDESRS
jgi:ABC-2 type transport system ATP-binding protein